MPEVAQMDDLLSSLPSLKSLEVFEMDLLFLGTNINGDVFSTLLSSLPCCIRSLRFCICRFLIKPLAGMLPGDRLRALETLSLEVSEQDEGAEERSF